MRKKKFFSNNYRIGAIKFNDKPDRTTMWLWQTGSVIGLGGAFIALSASYDLTIYAWLTGQNINTSTVGQIGICLNGAFFLLLMSGGCCLDKITKAKKSGNSKSESKNSTQDSLTRILASEN